MVLLEQAYKSTEQLVALILTVVKRYGANIFFRWMELSWIGVMHTRKRQEFFRTNSVGKFCKDAT